MAFVRNTMIHIHQQSDSKPQTQTTLHGVRAETQMFIFLSTEPSGFWLGPSKSAVLGLWVEKCSAVSFPASELTRETFKAPL